MDTYTTFELTSHLHVRWRGGKTFNMYSTDAYNTEHGNAWYLVDCFTDASVKTLEDATDAVVDFYNDLVGTGEIEDYR